MFANLSDLIKVPVSVALGAVVAAALLFPFYQGFSLPWIGQIYDGYLQVAVKAAIAQQKSDCDARVEKLTASSELATVRATLDRERALRRMADEAAAEASDRALSALKAKAEADDEVERLKLSAEQDQGLSRPNDKDRSWTPK